MYVIDEEHYRIEMEPILKQVFSLEDPDTDISFTDNISERRILFLNSIYLDNSLLNAIIHAAHSLEDEGCYVTLIDRISKQPNHCYIPVEEMHIALVEGELHRDLKMLFWSDYAIYSSQGRWGLLTTSGKYGLLGGSSEFIQQVELAFPALNNQVYDFLQYWKEEEIDAVKHTEHLEMLIRVKTWIPNLLKHIYGDELAMRMLQEVELCSDN
jgi:hypothetical protein